MDNKYDLIEILELVNRTRKFIKFYETGDTKFVNFDKTMLDCDGTMFGYKNIDILNDIDGCNECILMGLKTHLIYSRKTFEEYKSEEIKIYNDTSIMVEKLLNNIGEILKIREIEEKKIYDKDILIRAGKYLKEEMING